MIRTLVSWLSITTIALIGCGGSANDGPAAPDAMVDAPIDAAPARAPDLRFQWVGAFAGYRDHLMTNIAEGASLGVHGEAAWSPLMMNVAVGSSTAGWELVQFSPGVPIEALDSQAVTGEASALTDKLTELAGKGYVITSLDVASGVFALVATVAVSGSPAYAAATASSDRAGLSKLIATQAARGQVVTAVAGDGDQIRVLSFGRAGDATTYETEVADATPASLVATATTLAAAGYTITAFGRNGDGALLLIGTRPTGATAPHTITAHAELGASFTAPIVAWTFDPAAVTPDNPLGGTIVTEQ